MTNELDLTDDEIELYEAEQLVKDTNNADELTCFVVEDQYHPATRRDAAKKLIEMWKGNLYPVKLDHLAYVGDHADEPYKSEANRIIKNIL